MTVLAPVKVDASKIATGQGVEKRAEPVIVVSTSMYSVCPRLRTILEIEQTRDPLISYRKITWNPLISLEKILAFFSAEIMGSPNILLGIPLIKKYNRENHNI